MSVLAKHRKKQRKRSISYGDVFLSTANNDGLFGFAAKDTCGFKVLKQKEEEN